MRFVLSLELVVIGVCLHVVLLLLQATKEKYLPDVGEEAQHGTVRVASKSETNLGNFVVRKLVLSSAVQKASIVRFASINLSTFYHWPITVPSSHNTDVAAIILSFSLKIKQSVKRSWRRSTTREKWEINSIIQGTNQCSMTFLSEIMQRTMMKTVTCCKNNIKFLEAN